MVVDDEDRENEGDLIFAAEMATPELIAFMVRYTSGYICVPLPRAEADRLDLPPMFRTNQDRRGTAYTVTVDAREGVSTGISATDRAHTIRLLADPTSTPADFTRPGHVVPLRAKEGGVLRRPGHTEAAVDLAVLAGLRPAGVLCEIVSEKDPSGMARAEELRVFADEHGLALISIADLIAYRRRRERLVERVAEADVPLEQGVFRAIGYRSTYDAREHIAFVWATSARSRPGDAPRRRRRPGPRPLRVPHRRRVRVAALRLRAAAGRGPGRGRAPRAAASCCTCAVTRAGGSACCTSCRPTSCRTPGADTVDANLELGLPADARDYGTGAQILRDLGVRTMRLLSNNPAKRVGLEGYGLTVLGNVRLPVQVTPHNLRYLQTKRDRMGHVFEVEALDRGRGRSLGDRGATGRPGQRV